MYTNREEFEKRIAELFADYTMEWSLSNSPMSVISEHRDWDEFNDSVLIVYKFTEEAAEYGDQT